MWTSCSSPSDWSLHGVCLCEEQWDPDHHCGRWAKAAVSTHYSHNWLKVLCYRWLSCIRDISSENGDQNVKLSSQNWIRCMKEFSMHFEKVFSGCYRWSWSFFTERSIKEVSPLVDCTYPFGYHCAVIINKALVE